MDEGYWGPYAVVAALAERIEIDADALTVGRLVSSVFLERDRRVDDVALMVVVVLAPGRARGDARVTITQVSPHGAAIRRRSVDISFDEEGGTERLLWPLHFAPDDVGEYPFEVRVDDRLLTRIPLRVAYRTDGAR